MLRRAKAKKNVKPEVSLSPSQLFDDLVLCHSREIQLFLYKLCGSLHDAEELAQDVFVKAFRKLDTLRDRQSARKWLYSIAVNHFNDWIRPKKRSAMRAVGSIEDFEVVGNLSDLPSSRAMALELSAEFEQAILNLPDRQRSVILMHAAQGFDYADIASALGISADAVKMSMLHAREKLKSCVERYMK